jgi:uncharacterized protein YndB with AHSA1/START domain
MAEVRITDEALLEAPVDEVWAAIKDPTRHAEWHPFVTAISGEHRLGAIRSCSVIVGKKGGETKERCVEEVQERKLSWAIEEDSTGFSRMVSDWRAGFSLHAEDGATRVTAESTFRPKSALLRLMSPLVERKFHKAQLAILAALKQTAEKGEAHSPNRQT